MNGFIVFCTTGLSVVPPFPQRVVMFGHVVEVFRGESFSAVKVT